MASSKAEADESSLPIHGSARLVIVDDEGRLLLFRFHDEHRPPFWSTVGGRLEPGESYHSAAVRELAEETGFRAPIGPLLHVRDDVFATAGSGPARWIEHYFLVRSPGGEITRDGWTDEERVTIRAHRWWSLDEMRATDETFLPPLILGLLEEALSLIQPSA
ncbi:MAG TPA: NUDIX domain-containing protein [Longimicrobium sp.]|nr:NUDIX domain-containing protein [Longimicrobium sp.]